MFIIAQEMVRYLNVRPLVLSGRKVIFVNLNADRCAAPQNKYKFYEYFPDKADIQQGFLPLKNCQQGLHP
ncbi:hypothetical protein [Pantoea septica]|uniref:hypothetical protein n=1 Tax=Pantoea septica TaxID=472695 RepID=UPI003CFC18CF